MTGKTASRPLLEDLGQLTRALLTHQEDFYGRGRRTGFDGSLYCPVCGSVRLMRVSLLYATEIFKPLEGHRPANSIKELLSFILPTLMRYRCSEQNATFLALLYKGPAGADLMVVPDAAGGLSTPNTPVGVGYYLDQAQRAEAAGARSAAIAMYRGALDQVMFLEGFTEGMLGQKISELIQRIEGGKGPRWAGQLGPPFLSVLNQLGSGSIHPNDGDISRQAVLDPELLIKVKATFHRLLDLAYEAKVREAADLEALQSAASVVSPARPRRARAAR